MKNDDACRRRRFHGSDAGNDSHGRSWESLLIASSIAPNLHEGYAALITDSAMLARLMTMVSLHACRHHVQRMYAYLLWHCGSAPATSKPYNSLDPKTYREWPA